MAYQSGIRFENNHKQSINTSGKNSLTDSQINIHSFCNQIKSQQICKQKRQEYCCDISKENHPPRHRMPVKKPQNRRLKRSYHILFFQNISLLILLTTYYLLPTTYCQPPLNLFTFIPLKPYKLSQPPSLYLPHSYCFRWADRVPD